MRYVPQTVREREEMLASVGIASSEALFDCIPADVRLAEPPALPAPMSESQIVSHMSALAAKNNPAGLTATFLGAGVYDHYVPSVIRHITSRQEFLTSYTPYQPEISQGTLTAIFEYQTMICRLTGLDVSNASMYDTASAAAEAMLLSAGQTRRNKVALARSIHPEILATVKTYARFSDIEVVEIPWDEQGRVRIDMIPADVAGVFVQSPNFFGAVENMEQISAAAHEVGALAIAAVDPLSLALLKTPGETGFDIAIGETQPLGLKMSFGGPYCGFMAVREKLLRKVPGRICGQTTDTNGKRAFVLTLQAREQHIRREKATSNICSNQALCALASTIYLSLTGPEGLRECAAQSAWKSKYLYDRLIASGKFEPVFSAPFFREFTLRCKNAPQKLNSALAGSGFTGGYDLGPDFPELEGCLLLAVTEKRTKEEIDAFAERMTSL